MTTSADVVSSLTRTDDAAKNELRFGFPARCTDALGVKCSSIVDIVEILTSAVADGAMDMEQAQRMLQQAAEMAVPCKGISDRTLACGCAALRAASHELVEWYEAAE